MDYILLQHYWWFIIALLAGILVFMLFVQGGQTLIYTIAKTESQRSLVINSIGHKWDLTFTTLVTFGGAFFASFPLFYSTSFSGAVYVWMAILIFFVLQAVSFEYRTKSGNLLGQKTYEWFLILNGVFGTILLGAAVGTLFTGGNFIVERANIGDLGGNLSISQWQTPWHGLEAVTDFRNVALGLAVLFLSRMVAIHYFFNNIDNKEIKEQSKKPLIVSSALFLLFFLTFLISIMLSKGYAADPSSGIIYAEPYKYFLNMIDMPIVMIFLLAGIVSVLAGMFLGIKSQSSKAVWFSGIGVVTTVTSLLLILGYNNTSYYPSLTDMQSSLTITNSSSSEFTLTIMTYVSFIIPLVLAYIWYAWRAMNKTKMSDTASETEAY
ncbi:MAG: cytochrome d ubiquinol oxidase subunit II [Rikenellaceae bacterium]